MNWQFATLGSLVFIALALANQSVSAAEKSFPHKIVHPTGFQPEGFTIGKGTTAYSGALNGTIYKLDLRTGDSEILIEGEVQQDPPSPYVMNVLGMRVDSRTNYLFVAGGRTGKAFVYDADSGSRIAEYQLANENESIINDLTITHDAVYFTDSSNELLYRLPLNPNGGLPLDPGAATAIPLVGDFELGDVTECCAANGIVATADGKTLIIGHSNAVLLYRVDPITGEAHKISADVVEFPDGLVLIDRILYVISPTNQVEVMQLDENLLTGETVSVITDSTLDGPSSGANLNSSFYVVNSRWDLTPELTTEYWITKLDMHR